LGESCSAQDGLLHLFDLWSSQVLDDSEFDHAIIQLLSQPENKSIKNTMQSRADKRTPGQYLRDVANHTRKEKEHIKHWAKLLTREGIVLEWLSNGCGDDGAPLLEPTQAPDFKVRLSPSTDWEYLDIKETKQKYPFLTFKLSQLKHYQKAQCSILQLYGMETPAPEYTIITPAKINELLKITPEQHACFGFKWGVRVYQVNFPQYFVFRSWL